MPGPRALNEADRHLPLDEEVFLDHVGHFVADAASASAGLSRAGFAPTPVSVQVNPDPGGGPPRLTGTGNVCAMLERGYLEMLFKTADTPLGRELDAGRARYPGLHLAAFAIADADAQHVRLAAAGFRMQPLVRMQRPVETAEGEAVAGFEVVRVAPGEMAEGRIQVLRHRTEAAVWQPRWLSHPNTAVGLRALTVVVADPADAARRYARFLGRSAEPVADGVALRLDRGTVELVAPAAWGERWPRLACPDVPFMGAVTIDVRSLAAAEALLRDNGLEPWRSGDGLACRFPPELGTGVWLFQQCGRSGSEPRS